MAEMHPSSPLKGALSSVERKVFFALQDKLPSAFTALHSVALLTRLRKDSQRLLDCEIDFIVGHPAYGLLIIEVKGGGIRCDARSQRWTSISADGEEHDIKNPYEQARRNFYALQEELHASKLAKRFPFPGGYAVWFPDLELDSASLGLSAAYRQITLDATTLRSPETEIRRIFRECLVRTKEQPPTEAGITAMVRHLMPSWKIPVRLRTALADEEDTLVEATRSQHKVLSMLGRRKRALICGSAGSGKTFLALEKARRLSEEGREVLIVCFNIRLAEWLRGVTSKWRGIDVFHYHALCMHLCLLAGMAKPQPDPYGDTDAFFRYELPDAMLHALESVSQRYDAILVDEAQDFDPVWWIGIEQLLRDPAESLFYLFYDDNQLIYGSGLDFPIRESPLLLCENCRNTRTIFDGFMKFYQGDATPEPIGPAGRPVEVLDHTSGSGEVERVTRVLRRLLTEEQIPASAITILTPRAQSKSIWREGTRIEATAIPSWRSSPTPGAVSCASIHTFKGLENSVVVVTEVNNVHEAKRRELFYVAYSRAKFHLVVSRVC
jgi:hypothetical protein